MKVFTVDSVNYDHEAGVLCPICVSIQGKCDLEVCDGHYVPVGMVVSFFCYQEEQVYKDYLDGSTTFKDYSRLQLTNDFWKCRDYCRDTLVDYVKSKGGCILIDELIESYSLHVESKFKTDFPSCVIGAISILINQEELEISMSSDNDLIITTPAP